MKRKLFKHQIEGIKFLRERKKALLADEQGIGKTMQAVIAAGEESNGTLVICPASMKYTWEREIHIVYPEDVVQIMGEAMHEDAPAWYVINYDVLKKHKVHIQTLIENEKLDTVILDEAHYIKNSSIRTKEAIRICKKMDRVYLLTGTPILNRPMELYNLLKAMEHRLALDWMTYIRRYCGAFQRRNPYTGGMFWDTSGAKNIPELREKMSDIFLRREKKEVLDLPDKIRTTRTLILTKEWQKEYDNAWDNYLAFLEENPPDNMDNILQAKHLVELQKLKQVCSQAKIETITKDVIDMVEAGQKVVVFTQYKETLRTLSATLGKKKIGKVTLDGSTKPKDRQAVVDSFQNDEKIKVFIGNIKAAGVGITLTAASKVVFADLDWTPAVHEQAEDRCHRIGTTELVNAYYYVAKDTLEEDIIEMLRMKESIIRKLIKGEDTKTFKDNIVKDIAMRSMQKLST